MKNADVKIDNDLVNSDKTTARICWNALVEMPKFISIYSAQCILIQFATVFINDHRKYFGFFILCMELYISNKPF